MKDQSAYPPAQSFANQVLDRCDSTNLWARKLGEAGYPSGTWVAARVQDQGRGRLGRRWESVEGNLFLSMVARVELRPLWSWVPLMSAVCLARWIQKEVPEVPIQIKWPNDLCVARKNSYAKLGGILCEAFHPSSHPFLVIGIGLNCIRSPQLKDQAQLITSLSEESNGRSLFANDLLDSVVSALQTGVRRLEQEGSDWISHDFEELSLFKSGDFVSWGSPPQVGEFHGLGVYSELRVRRADGEVESLFAEDVQVRPFKHSEKGPLV